MSYFKETFHELIEDDQTGIYLNLFVLLYTIIIAESKEDLQLAIDGMSQYCIENRLTINRDKSNIIVHRFSVLLQDDQTGI